MPHAGLSATIARTRRAVVPADARPDGQLLAAFLQTRDPDAFTRLVTRLGPMVFAVCRRVTGHLQDAEDAFQAAFVVLARRAGSVSPPEAVGSWLYGVAVRVAKEARAVSARRRSREVPTATLPDMPRTDTPPDDIGIVLHEELEKLPEKFRTLLVLCDLRSEPQGEVAQRLGLPLGTLYSRLSAARKELAKRLRARGVSLSVAGLVLALTDAGQAAVPRDLLGKAVSAAMSPETLTGAVAALSTGVVHTMFVQKLTLAGVVALVVAVCAAAQSAPPTATPPARNARAEALPQVKPKAERSEISAPIAYEDLMLVLVRPEGVAAVVFSEPKDEDGAIVEYKFRYESADGKVNKSGDGKIFERRVNGVFDESGLYITAGPIELKWSRSNKTRGWVYYAPEELRVHLANAKEFADHTDPDLFDQPAERKKLDLKRFMVK